MYEMLKRMYLEGKLTDKMLENAVIKKWITKEEKDEIIASKPKEID